MKKVLEIFVLMFVLIILLFSEMVYAYSDDLFEFDLPSTYANLSYSSVHAFADTNNKNRGMLIYVHEHISMKKSVWDIDKGDLQNIVREIIGSNNTYTLERKAKLGKEKAAKITAKSGNDYFEIYILASNKYIYMVVFTRKIRG